MAVVPLGLGALAAASVLLARTDELDAGYWIDEGLSVGIADRPLTDIPGVMRQDGSPPLYYALLHVWMRIFGSHSEITTHWLSVVFATLAIPVAFVLADQLFGRRAGWLAAVLAALNPFLTDYAQETRMYSLVVLLSLLAAGLFAGAFCMDRGRRWVIGFAVSQVLLLYTHNWGLFLGLGLAVAWAILALTAHGEARKQLVRDGLLAAVVIGVLFAPWIPTLLFQTAHTGAPWANPPEFGDLTEAPTRLLGKTGFWLLAVAVAIGLPALRKRTEARAALALGTAIVVTLLAPWLLSQAEPAWAFRYTAILVAPLILLAALSLARAGRAGLVVATAVTIVWLGMGAPDHKSNAREVAEAITPAMRSGDVVISTQPEQVPVLGHYLAGIPGLRWATLTGPLTDLGVTDWRDGAERLEATSPQRDLAPLLKTVEPGQRVALISPDFAIRGRWRAPWTALVRQRSNAWEDFLRNDSRFRVVSVDPPFTLPRPNELRATVFVREPLP